MRKFAPVTLTWATASFLAVAALSACNKKVDEASVAAPAKSAPAATATASPAGAPGIEEFKSIAEEGFIYGLPIVMSYAVMNEYAVDKSSGQFKAPFNHILSEPRVFTYKDTAVITPNSDTPYSLGFLDLRAEPVVITVPAVEKDRYYSVQLTDGNTYNYGYIGSRSTGNEAGSYMVEAPTWSGDLPAGISKSFKSTTPFSIVVFRTQLLNPADMPNVEKVQAGYKIQTLSEFLGQSAPAAAPPINFVPATTEGIKKNFWEYLDAALEFVPSSDENREIQAKLARIGVGPGKTFSMKDLSEEHKLALLVAMKEGEDKVNKYIATAGTDINGWRVGSFFGDRAYFNGDWLMRAAAAKAGIFGNDAVEAMYPQTRVDAEGKTLDGSKHNYTLTFPAGSYPPVNAFWSLTMYDSKTQLLIENPINRYLINSPMLPDMKKNADGSMTLYIQKDSPGKDKESNWLPAPNGEIYVVMRLYWPKPATDEVSMLPAGTGTWKPPGIVVSK